MICQENVLKKNWEFNRGDLYIVDYDRGERPRKSTLEISIVLWPEDMKESTRWFYVTPITFDMKGIDPETDIPIRSRKELGHPFIASPRGGHSVREDRLLSYVGRLSAQTTQLIAEKTQKYAMEQFGLDGRRK